MCWRVLSLFELSSVCYPFCGLPFNSLIPHSARRYTPEHEAVEFDDENGTATVYITNHAQSALGDVVFVELPALETEVEKGGAFTSFATFGHDLITAQ